MFLLYIFILIKLDIYVFIIHKVQKSKDNVENAKGIISSRKPKNRQYNVEIKRTKTTNNDLQN
jgi:hypothetical protein